MESQEFDPWIQNLGFKREGNEGEWWGGEFRNDI
jgi:hypothetical protein